MMATALAIATIITLTYTTPPLLRYGIPWWLRRRHEQQAAHEAELIAMTAWLAEIRRP